MKIRAGIGQVLPRITPSNALRRSSGMQHHSKQWGTVRGRSDACPFPCDFKIFRVRLAEQWTPRPLADGEAEEILRIMQASVSRNKHTTGKKSGLQEAAF